VNPSIRNAILEDALALADLASELGYPTTPEVMRNRLRAILGKNDHLVLVATNDNGAVHGWVQAHAADFLESGLRVDIVGLIVAQRARRTGLGRLLVKEVEHWARALGSDVVAVRSNVERFESHLFYPAIGYTNVKTQVSYRKRLPTK
jgi:GNAT superfamily N-acetyltransferase